MNSTAQPDLDPQAPLPTGLTLVASRSTPPPRTSAEVESNRAFLAAAGRVEFGRYEATLRDIWMAFAYFASLSDARECYGTGEHIAEKARRSGRTVRRHVPALIDRGLIQSDNRKGGHDPSKWKVVLPADVGVGLTSVSPAVRGGQDVRAGRTQRPGRPDTTSDDIRDREKVQESTSSSARVFCPCGNSWPNKAEYGTTCYECGRSPSTGKPGTEPKADDKPKADPQACTCGEAYRQSYGRLCIDCKGKPSEAQSDAAREQDACRGVDDKGGSDGGGAESPSVPETETRQPPNGGEPGPAELQFKAELAKWTGPKRTKKLDRSDRRRMARAAQKEMADLAMGVDA